jgi:hypothetical protein
MPAKASAAARWLGASYLLLAVSFALHCSFVALRDHYSIPHVDDWRILGDLFSQPLVEWLLRDQNGHRVPTTLALLLLDYTFLRGQMHLLVVASLFCAWLAVGALAVGLRRDAGGADSIDCACLGFCVFCLFWAGSSFDLVWGANQGSQLGVMWLAIALASLSVHQRRRHAEPPRAGARLLIAAGLAAFAATFSHGMGAASWGALLVAACVARLRGWVIAAFVLAAVASVLLYATNLAHVPFGSFWAYLRYLETAPGKMFWVWMAFLGSPLAHAAGGLRWLAPPESFDFARLAGTLGMGGFLAYAAWLLFRRSRAGSAELLFAGLMAFSATGGVILMLNRFALPDTVVAERFLTWSSLFWMGGVSAAGNLLRQRSWGPVLVAPLLAALSLSLVPSLLGARLQQDENRYQQQTAAAMHLSGVRWDTLGKVGMARQVTVYPVVERLKRDRRSFFADGRDRLLGAPLAERLRPAPAGSCSGSVEQGRRIDALDRPAALLSGRVSRGPRDRPLSFVVLSDRAGIIRGFGAIGTPARTEPSPQARAAAPPTAPWSGFVNGVRRSDRYTAWGVLEGDEGACPLGSWRP